MSDRKATFPASRGTVDLNRSTVSRYIQLATLFRSRIEARIWSAGHRIPTVDELAEEYGVARATIRQALDQIEADGLIERFRAKGTFVRQTPTPRLWCDVQTDWSGLLRSRDGANIEILGIEENAAPPDLDAGIGTLAQAYVHLRRRHSRHGDAFLLADLYIDQRWWPKIDPEDLTRKTALSLIAGLPRIKIGDARQVLTIGSADVETAEQLDIPLNAPVAFVKRIAVDRRGVVVLIANGCYRGDLVRIDVALRTEAAPATTPRTTRGKKPAPR